MILGPFRTLFLLGLIAAPADAPAIGVFVKAGPEVRQLPDAERKAREKVLSARYKEEYKAWEQLAKDNRKQFGKNEEKWPEEQRRAARTAQERINATDAEILFLKVDPNYADSVGDLRKYIEERKRLHLAEKSEEAHLVVEVLVRKGSIGLRARNRVLCRVSLGARAKARRPRPEWDKVEWPGRPLYWSEGERTILHSYSSKEPWWSFLEAERNSWKAVAAWVADGLDEFAKENAEALTGVPAPKR